MITNSVLLVSSSIGPSVSPELLSDLDNKVRLGLQQYSDTFFNAVVFSALVVALGCALEGPEILHDIFPKLFSSFTWPSKDRLDKFERKVKKWGLVGWLLIVLGVAAEGVFEVFDHRASGFVQTFDEMLVADTQREAAKTYERAAIAMRDAEVAKLDAEDAKLRAQGASDKSDKETAKREELAAKTAERELTKKQQKDIGAACGNLYTYGNKKRILVRSYGMDKEGKDLATDISDALNSANLFTAINTGDIQTGVLDTGVLIFGPPEDETFTSCLAKALVDIGKLTEVSVNGISHMGSKTSGTVKFSGTTKFTGGSTVIPAGFRPAGSRVDVLVGRRPATIK